MDGCNLKAIDFMLFENDMTKEKKAPNIRDKEKDWERTREKEINSNEV